MVFDLNDILPKERQELDAEKRNEYAEHYAKLMQEKFRYIRKPDNGAAFDAIADYCGRWYAAKHGECSFPKRGLFLFGEPGTGKTTAAQMISGFCDIDYITVGALTKAFAIGSYAAFWKMVEEYNNLPLIVDDLGCEDATKTYGNEVPLPDFIRERERMWQEGGVCTFFTSNAKKRDDVTDRYGYNVCSRLLGMCDFIPFKGSDNRPKRQHAK